MENEKVRKSHKRLPLLDIKHAEVLPARPHIILSIVERGKTAKYKERLMAMGVYITVVCMGQGTASSDILDILGLEESEKEVLISVAPDWVARNFIKSLYDRFGGSVGSKGIACHIALSAAQNLIIRGLMYGSKTAKQEIDTMNNDNDKSKYSLIIISANQGYADEIMSCAKKAGARGGTLIRAREIGNELSSQLFGAQHTPERDVLIVLVPIDKRNPIMDAVNAEYGMRSAVAATVMALSVDDVAKLN